MCHTTITREDVLTERLFQGTIETLELYSVYLGKELGLYQALRSEPATPSELATRTEISPRYAREWLEQQAVAGFLAVGDAGKPAEERCYTLPKAHVGVLADDAHAAHVAPFSQMLVGIAGALPQVVDAYRSQTGVPYEQYGSAFRHGQGGIWSILALARAYPNAEVIGFDLDEASIAAARQHAREDGCDVRFVHDDAAQVAGEPFDLVLILEALHDMSQPTEVLRALRRVLAPDGAVLIADERVAENFQAPGDEI